jgi:transposase
VLLNLGLDIKPPAAIGDKGYESKANRDLCRKRGVVPVIPQKSNARRLSKHLPKALYKARARIEITVGRLKRFKRIALRCEKTARNFGSFDALVAEFNLIQFVHTAKALQRY